jgi:hypothetical protein
MSDIKTPLQRTPSDLTKAHAERLAEEAFQRAQQRQLDLADQRSAVNSPDMRIRTWERVHALRLPSDPEHPVLDVIAFGTGLTRAQVQREQQARVAQQAARAEKSRAGGTT